MRTRMRCCVLLGVLTAAALAAAPSSSAGVCGLPDAAPVWIDYGEGSVTPDVRAVFARPGVVVATSGTAVPQSFRDKGASTQFFVLKLPALVGDPAAPADPATIAGAADALLARAVASTGCSTPWIALNELLGAALTTPWSTTNAQYRANLLALVQRLAAAGAHPALLVHGDPSVAGDAGAWWQQMAQSADIVYEAYYSASAISALGPLMGNRRMRLGMRGVADRFESVGVPAARIGFMLGFHSAQTPGIGGRQGLQPREAWLRVVKWEALAALQVTKEEQTGSIWSWGWGTFGPDSVDADKAAAACVYLWARDSSLCDGVAVGGPAFNPSLVEGQLVLREGETCSFAGGGIRTVAVDELARLTRNRHSALTALFARAALQAAVKVTDAQVAAVERGLVARAFHGKRSAYLRALTKRHATIVLARAVIRDELRRRALARRLGAAESTLQWTDDRESKRAETLTCLHDDLPGTGDFPSSNTREIGVVQLPRSLPFLFADRRPPAAPAAATATAAPDTVSLTWPYGLEPDLAGYEVFRAATAGGPYTRITKELLPRPALVDAPGAPAFYVVRAVDSSGNESAPSPEAAASPGQAPPPS